MKIVWDERKREANFKTHHLDFSEAERFDWANAIIRPSHSERLKAIGYVGETLIALIFALRGTEGISVISLRPASKSERRLHGTR